MSNNDQVLKTVKEFFGIQDLMEGTNKQVLHQTEQSPLPSNQRYRPLQMITARRTNNGYSLDELLAPRELPPVTVGSRRNRDQVVQTEKSSPSDSLKEILGISDSPVTKKMKTSPTNLTVFVQPYEESRRIFVVKVNANYNVKALRKELVKLQEKGKLNLPEEGYHFIVRDKTLNETQSFMWNLVADGDTIEVIRDQA